MLQSFQNNVTQKAAETQSFPYLKMSRVIKRSINSHLMIMHIIQCLWHCCAKHLVNTSNAVLGLKKSKKTNTKDREKHQFNVVIFHDLQISRYS